MSAKNAKRFIIILLAIILLLCLGLWSLQRTVPFTLFESDTGVFDLRDVDFSQVLALSTCTVEYVPDVLLTPDEFEQRNDIRVGSIPEDTLVCTARIRFLVPDDRQYGISGYSLNFASRVYINGKWLFDEGTPGLSPSEEIGSEAFYLFSAEPHNGVIEIVIATSSYSYRETDPGMEWLIGDYQTARANYVNYTFANFWMMAWYLIIALVFFLLYLMLPAHKANGCLVILALVFALHTGLSGSRPLCTLFPSLTWNVCYKMDMLTIPFSAVLFMVVLNSNFPGIFPRWLQYTTAGLAGVMGLIIFFFPVRTLSEYSFIQNMFVYLLVAVAVICVPLSLRKNRPGLPQWIILAGLSLVLLATVWDMIYYGGNPFRMKYSILQPMMVVFFLFLLTSAALTTIQKITDMENEAAKLRVETLEQEVETTKARTAVMLSQIQPHFLYNTLTTISDYYYGTPKAQDAIRTLAHYLRGNMNSLSQTKPIPFELELEHVEQYLSLEQMRFGDLLKINYDIQTTSFLLPVLTLQPIVENAVRHGITQKVTGGTLTIHTEEKPQTFCITVQDDGIGFNPDAPLSTDRPHIGIENVRSRLWAMCKGTLALESFSGKGTTVTIEIPKGEAENEHYCSR